MERGWGRRKREEESEIEDGERGGERYWINIWVCVD